MSDKITTRQKITDAAKNLFASHSYNRTTIDDIITAAGVTKGAFYHYFKSKDGICCEIIASAQNDYQNILDSLPKKINPLEKLKLLIKHFLESDNSQFLLRLSLETELTQAAVKQDLDSFWKRQTEQYRQLITQCRESNLIGKKLSALQQTDLIISILIGNIWLKTALCKNADEEMIEYIIGRL